MVSASTALSLIRMVAFAADYHVNVVEAKDNVVAHLTTIQHSDITNAEWATVSSILCHLICIYQDSHEDYLAEILEYGYDRVFLGKE